MMDSLASGTLGMLTVAAPDKPVVGKPMGSATGTGLVESLKGMVHALSFLNDQVGLLRLTDHVYADESNLQSVITCTKQLLKLKQ